MTGNPNVFDVSQLMQSGWMITEIQLLYTWNSNIIEVNYRDICSDSTTLRGLLVTSTQVRYDHFAVGELQGTIGIRGTPVRLLRTIIWLCVMGRGTSRRVFQLTTHDHNSRNKTVTSLVFYIYVYIYLDVLHDSFSIFKCITMIYKRTAVLRWLSVMPLCTTFLSQDHTMTTDTPAMHMYIYIYKRRPSPLRAGYEGYARPIDLT